MKCCTGCLEYKPPEEFYLQGRGRKERKALCRSCCYKRYSRKKDTELARIQHVQHDLRRLGKKMCFTCNTVKDLSEFRATHKGYDSRCKTCKRNYMAEFNRRRSAAFRLCRELNLID